MAWRKGGDVLLQPARLEAAAVHGQRTADLRAPETVEAGAPDREDVDLALVQRQPSGWRWKSKAISGPTTPAHTCAR
eukprot:8037837-Alexandrium_andersonii.AAC.1